jgi:hypothetical protein
MRLMLLRMRTACLGKRKLERIICAQADVDADPAIDMSTGPSKLHCVSLEVGREGISVVSQEEGAVRRMSLADAVFSTYLLLRGDIAMPI